jgi:hypothetical protein
MAILDSTEMLQTAFEPMVQHRFKLQIGGIPAFMVKNVKAPNFTDSMIKLDHINSYRKIRGKREWQDMDMVLYSPITPSGAQAVMEWARLGYESVTGRAGYSDFYKQDLYLEILGPVGDIVGEWIIKGAFLTKGDFGQFDWTSNDGLVDIAISVAMDYCILNF